MKTIILSVVLGLAGVCNASRDTEEQHYNYMEHAGHLPAWEKMYQYDDNWSSNKLYNEAERPPIKPTESEKRKV